MQSRGVGVSPWRLCFVLFFLAACTLALIARIAYLQIIEHPEFVRQADEVHWARQTVAPQRGAIKDRNGHPLALSSSTWEIGLDFTHVRSADLRSRAIAAVARAIG